MPDSASGIGLFETAQSKKNGTCNRSACFPAPWGLPCPSAANYLRRSQTSACVSPLSPFGARSFRLLLATPRRKIPFISNDPASRNNFSRLVHASSLPMKTKTIKRSKQNTRDWSCAMHRTKVVVACALWWLQLSHELPEF